MPKESKEIAIPSSPVTFAVMGIEQDKIREILNENLGSEMITAMELPQVSVPAGGGVVWNVPSIDGEMDVKAIRGIIIATQHTRAYWSTKFDETGGGTPPECLSEDGETGIGIPGGMCHTCPYSKFGSAANKRGKACQEKRLLFVLMEKDVLPIVVKAPSMSLKGTKAYLMGLTSRGQKLHSVYTELTLEKDKNADGIVYSKIVLKKVGDVEDPAKLEAYSMAIKPYLMRAARDIAQQRDPLERTVDM